MTTTINQPPTPTESTVPPAPDTPTVDAKMRRQRALWRLLIVGVLLAFGWLLVEGLQRQNESGQRATGVAPDFTLTTFDGETITLADLKGKGVVINFWASWCNPCRAEAEILETAWQRERDNGIVFVGVDYLDQEEPAREFLAEYGVSYPNGRDLQSKVARRYGVRGVPETFFIAPDGTITQYVEGVIVSDAQMNDYLDKIRPE